MRVQAYGSIKPAAKFGVPDGDAIVFPGGDIHGHPVLSVPLVKFGWGSMPRYREDDEAIKLCLTLGTITLELKDNYFIARGKFSNFKEAQKSISDSLQIFVSSLSVADSALYTIR